MNIQWHRDEGFYDGLGEAGQRALTQWQQCQERFEVARKAAEATQDPVLLEYILANSALFDATLLAYAESHKQALRELSARVKRLESKVSGQAEP